MYRKRKQKSIIIICLLMVLTLMSIGYAAFQTKVKVKGTTRITSLWDVRITNVTAGTATGGAENKITPTWDGLTANMEANLYAPGDAMEYDVTITNNGTIDAVLSDVIGTPSNNDAVIITFSGYAKGEKLYKNGQQGNTKTVHVKIEYNPAYTGGETSGQASVEFTYTQGEGGEVQPTGDQYLLTYDYSENGGTSATTHNEYVNSGSTVTISGTASKMGWTFVGWNTNKDATTGLSTIVMDSNKTLYAIYRKEAVTLTAKWNANNATLSSTSNLTCTIPAVYNKQTQGTSCEVTAPTITAPANTPTVLGFNTSSDSNSNNEAYNASNGKLTLTSNSDNKTWYAQTTKAKVTLTAKFNANGATLSSSANKTCDLAATFNGVAQATSCTVDAPTITAPANTPTVLGFNTSADSNSNSEAYNASNGKITLTSSNNNSTWYAQTTKAKVTLTAKWNANNATLSSTTNKTCDLGATFNGAAQATSCTVEAPTITAPANTPTILGFNTSASSNANNAAYSTDTGELTLTSSLDNKTWYAQTTKAKVNRTITFYRNSNTSFTYNGTTYTDTSKAFTVCSIAATYNGVAQATSCTVPSITMATIAAPEATPTIIGWSTGASTRTATYTSGQELTNLEMTANKKLYAQSTKAKVTLTAKFNANGATLSSTANQTCDLAAVYNGAAQATSCTVDAPTITRSGYDIIGFNTAAGSTTNNASYDTSTGKITLTSSNNNTTWYAVTKNQTAFTASWNANGATLSSATALSCNTYNTATTCTVDAPTITRSGYTIVGYNTSAGATTNNTNYNASTGKLTLSASGTWYAVTKNNTAFTASWNANGATLSSTTALSCNTYNTQTSCTVTAPTITAPENTPTVLGWNTSASSNANNTNYNTSTGKLTISASGTWYAQTTKAKVTLTANWNANNATLSSTTSKTCDLAATFNGAAQATSCTVDAPTITAPANTPTILGFNTSASSNANNNAYSTSTGKLTLTSSLNNKTWYAQTTKAKVTLTAKWNANGATLSSTANKTCDLAAVYNGAAQATSCTVDAPTITRDGYTIIGYNTTAGATTNNSAYSSSTGKVTMTSSLDNKTWYAVTKKTDAFTASFNANGATLSSTTALSCNIYNTQTTCTVDAPTITRSGYDIIGFNTSASSTTNNTNYNTSTGKLTLSASGTWYAVTKNSTVFTASWNANGATLSSTANKSCNTYNTATTCTVDAPTITRSGYDIIGFNTSASSTTNNTNYNTSTKKLTLSGSGTWYAVTKNNTAFTASFNANGATLSSTASKSCNTYNTATTCTVDAPTITRSGYDIIGFNTAAGSTTNNTNYNTSTGKLTLSASGTWYAVTKNSTAFTASWNANGATLSSTTALSCNTYNTATTCTVDAPTITRSGYDIIGFNTSASSTTNNTNYNTSTKKLTLSSSGTWYAVTKNSTAFTASWNANNATLSSTTAQSCNTYNTQTSCTVTAPTITAPENTPTVLGWNTAAGSNANNTNYNTSTGKLTISASGTWYAQTTKAKVTLTANWNANNATLSSTTSKTCDLAATFNGAAQATSCTVDAPTITAPANTPTILGFNTSASSNANNNAYSTSTGKLTLTSSLNNKTWYAQTTKAKVTLTAKWNANGATLSSTANKTCDLAAVYNGAAQATSCTVDAPTITRDGYTIIGYNTTAGATTNNSAYSSSTGKVTMTSSLNNTTWYAVTKNNTAFTASWNANGATLSSTANKSCNTYNTATTCTVDAPTITRSGYDIIGFNTSASSTTNNTNYNTSTKKLTLSGNGTWYAVTKNQTAFTASWNANNATLSSTTAQSCNTYNTQTSCTVTAPTITAPSNTPTVLGWNTAASSNANNTNYNTSTGKLTISASGTWYAQTTKAKVTLTANWNANNATLSSTTSKTCDLAATFNGAAQATSCTVDAPTITAPANTPTILGFNTSASSNANNNAYSTSTGKLTLTSSLNNKTWYAQTTKAKVTLTAKWNANGATLSSTANKTCDLAAVYNGAAQATSCTVDAPTITRDGYTIIGYNTTAGATTNNSAYSSSTGKVTMTSSLNNTTWYAVTKNNTAFTASWNANGATLSSTANKSCNTYNTATTCTVDAPTITRDGYTIIGFNTTAGATTNNTNYNTSTKKLTLSASGTWYAVTKNNTAFTASWNANGATLSSTANKSCNTYNTATTCTVDAPTITRSGYDIIGYNTTAGATTNNTNYNTSTKKLTLSGNGTWYAVTKNQTAFTATWNANNATLSSTTAQSCNTYNTQTSCTVTAPTITGPANTPTVLGWNTAAGSNANNSAYNTSTKALTLSASGTWYAQTTKAKVTLTANWNANNATLSSTASKTCDLAATFNGTAQATSCTVDAPTITAPTNTPTILGFNTAASSNANNSAYSTSTKKLTLTSSLNNKTWYAQTTKAKVNRTITFYRNSNTSFTYSGTTYTDTSKAFTVCSIAATFNGTAQATSCTVASITMATITAPSATPTIIGWSTGASTRTATYTSGEALTNLEMTANKTLYAQTTKAKVTLTAKWNANGATLSSTANKTCNLAAVYNGAAQATSCTVDAPTITRDGYTIIGYNTTAGATTNNSAYSSSTGKVTMTSSLNNTTWYAVTKNNTAFTASWNANGATLSSTTAQSCNTYNTATTCQVTAPTITRSGYTIVGYNTAASSTTNNTNYNASTGKLTISASGTWYAVTKNNTAFTASWNANGATLSSTTAQSCNTYNTATTCTVDAPTITRSGYTIVGYNTSAGATTNNTNYNTSTKKLTLSGNGTWYAVTKNNTAFTASWNANGATLSSTTAQSCNTYNTATTCQVTAPTITRSGYTIVGYNTSAGATTNNTNYNASTSKLTISASGTWYAVTKNNTAFTASWNANGATLSSTTAQSCNTYNTATTCQVTAPTITRSGFDIIGFNTSASSTANNTNYNTSTKKLTISANGTWYALTKKDVTITFAKGSNTSAIGSTSGACTIRNSATNCTVATPTIAPNSGFLSVGWSTTNGATTGTKAGNNITVTGNTTYYGNSQTGLPTYTENTPGEVTITFPRGCSSPYTCKYKINSGSDVSVTSGNTVTVSLGTDGSVTATATDGSNTASSTYNLIKRDLYVSNSGNDTTGYGTPSKPYLTIAKAYDSATSTDEATIYIMNNITETAVTQLSSGKTITLTSSDESGITGDSIINQIIKDDSFNTNNYMIELQTGDLTFRNIILEGKSVRHGGGAFLVAHGATSKLLNGTTIRNFISYTSNGPAIRANDGSSATSTDEVTIDGAIITGNECSNVGGSAGAGGAVFIGPYSSVRMKGGSITLNTSGSDGGGVCIMGGATLNIEGGLISSNVSGKNGGGISVSQNGQLIMSNGSIGNNKATYNGGGIYATVDTSINFSGGTIISNETTATSDSYGGGGIFLRESASFTMTGGAITSNQAPFGGGVAKYWSGATSYSGTFAISGGTIDYNRATVSSGGGVYCDGAMTMNGGEISNNTAKTYGGAIRKNKNALTLSGGTIKKNTAGTSSGGLSIQSPATYSRTAGYVCKNNSPTNSYDVTATTDSHCS